MLRIYQYINERLSSLMSRHEKRIFTTGARLLAAVCIIVAVCIVRDCSSQIF